MSEVKTFEFNWAGRPLKIEIGEVAKQANGACLVRYGDSVVLSAVCSKASETTQDFFPLMVLYQEKLYAAGKIPGGFLRREGRASEHETLTSRLIDRPIRPLFAEGFSDEVQVINTVLSSDPDCSTAMAAMLGSSIALMISDVPFEGPIAGVQVGYVDGEYIINPTPEQLERTKITLTVAGTKDAINMVEAGASEVSEAEMHKALVFGHQNIIELCKFQLEIAAQCGKEKVKPLLFVTDKEIDSEVRAYAEEDLVKAIRIEDKLLRYQAIDEVNARTLEEFGKKVFTKNLGEIVVEDTDKKKDYLQQVQHTLDDILYTEVRRMIAVDKIRPDGRKVDEIRPLSSRVDVLPRAHGSALFTRGQTQSLGVTTLGALNENQIIDGLGIEDTKRFMFHYNFPQFSVGEIGRMGTPGRREIGHGALAERALSYVIPDEDTFPYTIRVVSEILESNGSSSQASICAGCMSLMTAGVPIKAPVAGIAMGLITEDGTCDSNYTILTDIQGLEDHMGDMDFKVTGTHKGITAIQMDIKIHGLTRPIVEEAIGRAREARIYIMDEVMSKAIEEPRKEVSTFAPKIVQIQINPDKIGDVVGQRGKTINEIIDRTGVKIDITDDGAVSVCGTDAEMMNKAIEMIKIITTDFAEGQIFTGTVVSIKEFGAFVEFAPGKEGMVHISKISKERINRVEDVLTLGDKVKVVCLGKDKMGRISFSMKDVPAEA